MANSRPAVLFDIDGTLVDSNFLHVYAWQRAFTEVGLPVRVESRAMVVLKAQP